MDPVELALADLARSGISADEAWRFELGVVDSAREVHPSFRPLPALVIPYYNPDGSPMLAPDGSHFKRVRYLGEQADVGGFTKRKGQRYSQPPGSGVRAYFPPGKDWAAALKNGVCITEGEKKAIAATLAGVPTIALGGVYNFMADDRLIPDLEQFNWLNAKIVLCFDSDAASNPEIQIAELRLIRELMVNRGADLRLARIQPAIAEADENGKARAGKKRGIDDLIVDEGAPAFVATVMAAKAMGAIEKAVLDMNTRVAWIENEDGLIDLKSKTFVSKDSFKSGSAFSSVMVEKRVAVGTKGDAVGKEVPLAPIWLNHPNALRYKDVVFKPDGDETVTTENGEVAYNLFNGFISRPGDVSPFLELDAYLFQKLPPEHRDFPMKLMAYKAQNPTRKIPIAIVITGPQGSGKSMWCHAIRAAFDPYSARILSKHIGGDFNNWVERSLICFIDEAKGVEFAKNKDILRALISELRTPFNEKFRPAKQIDSYTMYIAASNDRASGSFDHDDRRMFVSDAPAPNTEEFYRRVGLFCETHGPEIMHYLLNYDLKGWTPPARAPMTSEKAMAHIEGLTPLQRIAEDMKTADFNVVKRWLDATAVWAREAIVSNNPALIRRGKELELGMKNLQIRPYYTPEELSYMLPSILSSFTSAKATDLNPGEISRQLRECGIFFRECLDNPKGFYWRGQVRQYLVIANADDYGLPTTQANFELEMQNWPMYGSLSA